MSVEAQKWQSLEQQSQSVPSWLPCGKRVYRSAAVVRSPRQVVGGTLVGKFPSLELVGKSHWVAEPVGYLVMVGRGWGKLNRYSR